MAGALLGAYAMQRVLTRIRLFTIRIIAFVGIGGGAGFIASACAVKVTGHEGATADTILVEPRPPPPREVAQVVIDTNATMGLNPGEEVGLFVQYAEGGHWNLSTSCDTRVSNEPCGFDLVIVPEPGESFSAVQGEELSRDDRLELREDGTIRLVTRTSEGLDGITFDSRPGAFVKIDMLLDGVPRPELVYVVSNGAEPPGVPENPIAFVPSSP